MTKYSFTDLKIVLILTFLSLLFLFIPSLNQYPQSIVSYALLLLILPGYSLLVTIKPSLDGIDVWRRVLFSIILGVTLIAVVYLLWMYTPLISYLTPLLSYLTPLETYVSLLETYIPLVLILSTILIVDLVLIAWARRKSLNSPETPEVKERYVWCKDCQRYYKLEEDESPEDFESCYCGGKLTCTEKFEGEPFTPEKEIKPIQKGSHYLDLLLVFLLTIISLVALQFVNQSVINTIVQFILILFLPGYSLISAVYPGKSDLSPLTRVIYSIASSIAITALVGLVLNYSPYSEMLNPILYVLSGFTLVLLVAAYLRRRRKEDCFRIDFGGFIRNKGKTFSRENRTEKLLSLMLVISLVLVGFTTYITANPLEETYTNFTVLGSDGNVVNAINLTSNEAENLTISILNQENRKTTYRVMVTSGGNVLMDQTVTLENEERKDIPFTFTVGEPGTREMEFNLYKLPENNNIYKSLKIPLNVAVNPDL